MGLDITAITTIPAGDIIMGSVDTTVTTTTAMDTATGTN